MKRRRINTTNSSDCKANPKVVNIALGVLPFIAPVYTLLLFFNGSVCDMKSF